METILRETSNLIFTLINNETAQNCSIKGLQNYDK